MHQQQPHHEQIISRQHECENIGKHDISIIECLPSTWHVIYCSHSSVSAQDT
jgi:hypothetical protein